MGKAVQLWSIERGGAPPWVVEWTEIDPEEEEEVEGEEEEEEEEEAESVRKVPTRRGEGEAEACSRCSRCSKAAPSPCHGRAEHPPPLSPCPSPTIPHRPPPIPPWPPPSHHRPPPRPAVAVTEAVAVSRKGRGDRVRRPLLCLDLLHTCHHSIQVYVLDEAPQHV